MDIEYEVNIMATEIKAPSTVASPQWPARNEPELYHDLMSPVETLAIRAEVRAFAQRVVAPRARDIGEGPESIDRFPWDVFQEMGASGLFRIPFAAEFGGRGLTHPAAATAVVIEELSYYSSSVGAIYDVHCILAGHALVQGSADLQRRYLAPLLAGEVVGSFATTEPDASTDLSVASMVTDATKVDGGFRVSGHKRWITNSPVAGFVIILCRDGDSMTELVVDLNAKGVVVGKPDRKIGNNGQLTALREHVSGSVWELRCASAYSKCNQSVQLLAERRNEITALSMEWLAYARCVAG
jgi:butyryl-CoA dehydrogenase